MIMNCDWKEEVVAVSVFWPENRLKTRGHHVNPVKITENLLEAKTPHSSPER
jgi:hypothetical protein